MIWDDRNPLHPSRTVAQCPGKCTSMDGSRLRPGHWIPLVVTRKLKAGGVLDLAVLFSGTAGLGMVVLCATKVGLRYPIRAAWLVATYASSICNTFAQLPRARINERAALRMLMRRSTSHRGCREVSIMHGKFRYCRTERIAIPGVCGIGQDWKKQRTSSRSYVVLHDKNVLCKARLQSINTTNGHARVATG